MMQCYSCYVRVSILWPLIKSIWWESLSMMIHRFFKALRLREYYWYALVSSFLLSKGTFMEAHIIITFYPSVGGINPPWSVLHCFGVFLRWFSSPWTITHSLLSSFPLDPIASCWNHFLISVISIIAKTEIISSVLRKPSDSTFSNGCCNRESGEFLNVSK